MGILRIILALSVVLSHSGPLFGLKFVGGQIAVQAFYIISGFYMTLILNEKYIGSKGSYKLFITNRLLRLYPIYWSVLIITILISIFIGIKSDGSYWLRLQPYILYYQSMNVGTFLFLILTNILLLGQDILMFLGLNLETGKFYFTSNFWNTNPQVNNFLIIFQSWTIGVEILFYLVAPFIVRRKLWVIFTLIFLSLSLRFLLYRFGYYNDPWNYRFFPNELLFFLLGTLSYRIYKVIDKIEINKYILYAIEGIIILITLFFWDISVDYKEPFYFFILFLALPFIFKLSKKAKLDNSIGELSYPIYLSHMIFVLFRDRLQGLFELFGFGLTVCFLAIAFSIILKKFVSDPVETLRQKRVSV